MANARARYLSAEEIDTIVTPLLITDFDGYGYRDKSIAEDKTFDGDPIIRVKAVVDQPVPVAELVKTLGRIHDALGARDDDRLVFLSAPGPEKAFQGDDDEEDLD